MSKQQTLIITWNTFKEKKPQDVWKIFVKERDDDPGAMYAASCYKNRLLIQFTNIEKEINPEWQWFYASELEYNKQNNTQAPTTEFNPKTVKIGNIFWMTENLAYNDGGEGIIYNPKNNEYYYTWDAAIRVAKKLGWKLPSDENWNKACEECNGVKDIYDDYDNCLLKEKLNVKLTGYHGDGFFHCVGYYSEFWSDAEGDNYAWYRSFDARTAVNRKLINKSYGFSVRLVKDI